MNCARRKQGESSISEFVIEPQISGYLLSLSVLDEKTLSSVSLLVLSGRALCHGSKGSSPYDMYHSMMHNGKVLLFLLLLAFSKS